MSLKLKPLVKDKIQLDDRLSNFACHCIPLIFGGIALTLYSYIASPYEYGYTLYELFPARSPLYNSSDLEEILIDFPRIQPGLARTAEQQASIQFVFLIVTIVTALTIGAVTTVIALQVEIFDPLTSSLHFTDSVNWSPSSNNASLPSNESNVNISNFTDERTVKDDPSPQPV